MPLPASLLIKLALNTGSLVWGAVQWRTMWRTVQKWPEEKRALNESIENKTRLLNIIAESHPNGRELLEHECLLPVVFISYAFDDADLADEVKEFLERSKLKLVVEKLEPQSLLGKNDLSEQLVGCIERSTFFIPICTYHGNRSAWVSMEVEQALTCAATKGLPRTIPIVVDKEGLADSLKSIPYINAQGGFTRRVKDMLRQYISGITVVGDAAAKTSG
jgi:hypothetical protein